MKVFTVIGYTGSGKTTTIENLIKEFVKRGYSVGTVKEIHFEAFKMDAEGKNTYRHRQAGAETVTALGYHETDVLYKGAMNIYDVLKHYNQDIVILEGTRNAVVPEIVVCGEDKIPELTPLTIAVSGKYSNTHSGDYEGMPIINAVTEVERLADLILEKTPPLMYDMDPKCCSLCGTDCRGLLSDILKGKRSYSECVLNNRDITLSIDGSDVPMVPFVQNLLKNVTLGVVSELKGYSKNSEIIIRIKQNG